MRLPLICCLILISTITYSQQSSKHIRQFKGVIKTNVLNLFMIPSVHYEHRIADKSSILLNFHRGKITFITENNWLNAAVEFRKYFSKKNSDTLWGWYLSGGISYKYDYEDVILDDLDMIIKVGKPQLGIIARAGYQFGLSDNFIMDLGAGLVAFSDLHEYKRAPLEGEFRLMAGVGYRF